MANEKVQEKIAMPEGIHAELQAKTVTLKSAKGSVSKKFKAKKFFLFPNFWKNKTEITKPA